MANITIKRALISVFDKTGVLDLAKTLADDGVEILSTGGTYKLLTENGVKCVKIEDFTGQKEIFGGRVKTLHTKIHAGILSKRDKEAEDLKTEHIDLICVNLYPFGKLINDNVREMDKLIEMIDIGGPTMIRAASKNYKHVCVIPSAAYYDEFIEAYKNNNITEEFRLKMAIETFRTTAYYDSVISKTLFNVSTGKSLFDTIENETVALPLNKVLDMRYGENPHQYASYNAIPTFADEDISKFFTDGKIHGKELSYNNIADISGAMRILSDLPDNACVVVKHSNPCGCAAKATTFESYKAAYEGDSVSIFGGIVGFRGKVDKQTAELLSQIFLEIIICEKFDADALEILSAKKNIRLMEYSAWKDQIFKYENNFEMKKVLGGVLIQERDRINPGKDEEMNVITNAKPTAAQIEDMKFGQTLVKHVKSNAIVVVKDKMLLGVGAGQMNRVTSARIALDWAGDKAKGAILASDAFFPMPDTVELAIERGISAIVQPGGSIRDQDSIDVCNANNLPMVFTGKRHFLH